jgi:hypothetical protein
MQVQWARMKILQTQAVETLHNCSKGSSSKLPNRCKPAAVNPVSAELEWGHLVAAMNQKLLTPVPSVVPGVECWVVCIVYPPPVPFPAPDRSLHH